MSCELPPGRVFTPPALAADLWRRALALVEPRRGRLRALEPAAGAGALVRAGLSACQGIELTAVELAPDLVDTLRREQGERVRVVHADALALGRGNLANTSAGIAFGGRAPEELAGTHPDLIEGGTFDLVVANPPYLRETGNREVFRALRSWAAGALDPMYRKDCDLHHFFWEAAARQLRPGGILAFLTPAYFFDSEAAEPLRRFLVTAGSVEAIWRARRRLVFPDAGVEAAVTIWRKGSLDTPVDTELLDGSLDGTGERVRLSADGSPWWLGSAPELLDLEGLPNRLGDLYSVSEGVSTGANRLRAVDAGRIAGGTPGEGIFVLRQGELRALELSEEESARFVRARWGGRGQEWVLVVRDRDLISLDLGAPPTSALEHHLTRFRPVLERRAEIARNSRRSWYAVTWPRNATVAAGSLVTPKWALEPSFSILSIGAVPMTDHRILVPRTPEVAVAAPTLCAWLQGARVRPWLEQRMKRKGDMIEWYGRPLSEVPMPIVAG